MDPAAPILAFLKSPPTKMIDCEQYSLLAVIPVLVFHEAVDQVPLGPGGFVKAVRAGEERVGRGGKRPDPGVPAPSASRPERPIQLRLKVVTGPAILKTVIDI